MRESGTQSSSARMLLLTLYVSGSKRPQQRNQLLLTQNAVVHILVARQVLYGLAYTQLGEEMDDGQ